MFYILCSTIILLPVLAGLGAVFQKLFGRFWEGLSFEIVAGVFSVAIVFSVLSFFAPLNLAVEIPVLILGLISFFYFKSYQRFWNFFSANGFVFPVISVFILIFGAFYPFILDHFGYYVPTIKWLSEVDLVKGISNLDWVLGQMSVWHIFQAGFSNLLDPFLRINAVILIIYLIYIFEKKSWIHLVFVPVLLLFCQSPSTDLPVIVFSMMILNEIFSFNKNSSLIFALSVFVFAIKPTMIWLPILCFLYPILILKSPFKFILPGIVLLILFCLKNIWTFGFPVFPVQLLDFDVSWKPSAEIFKNSAQTAILKTYDMQYSYDEIRKFSAVDHVVNWLSLDGIKGKIHVFFLVSLIGFFIFSFIKKSRLVWLVFISIVIKSVMILLFSAQYRFFIDVFFVIIFVMFFKMFSKSASVLVFTVMSLLIGIFLSFPQLLKNNLPSFRMGSLMGGFKLEQLYKPSQYSWNRYKTYQIGNLKFNVVSGYILSYDIPLPAVSPDFIKENIEAGIFPQLEGKTLKEGFIFKKITDQEKLQIQNIIAEYEQSFKEDY